MIYIYTLKDPITNKVMYVGATKYPSKRHSVHCSVGKKLYWSSTHKDFWNYRLNQLGLKPVMDVIDECCDITWEAMEIFWISYYRVLNPCLLNRALGGKSSKCKIKKQ